MLKNYLKVTLRNLRRRKGYAFINVSGLAIGLASTIMILLWVQDELSFDRFHENADLIYRVEEDQDYNGDIYHVTVTPPAAAPVFEADIPEVVRATRYIRIGSPELTYGDKVFVESGARSVDPAFLQMFSFPLRDGDPNTALATPSSIVISEEIATKLFGDEEPVGKAVTMRDQPMTVTGVMQEVPPNSSMDFNILVSTSYLTANGADLSGWGGNWATTYVQLAGPTPANVINEKLTELYVANNPGKTKMTTMPLTDIHLKSYIGYKKESEGIRYIYIFSVIALFVLLIASINFMNLVTARSTDRVREIGMRQVVGANRRQLVLQFLGESVVLSLLSLVLAVGLVALLLGTFNQVAGKEMTLSVLARPWFIGGALAISLVTGLLAGSYPALYLSRFRPVSIIKGASRSAASKTMLRKSLVVLQFGLSIFLLIGTGVVYSQLQYMRHKDPGYVREGLVSVPLSSNAPAQQTLMAEWEKSPAIESVAAAQHLPSLIGSNSGGADWDGRDPNYNPLVGMTRVGYDYFKTTGMEMVEGRAFSRDFPSDVAKDGKGAFVINQTMAKMMDKPSIVGETLRFQGIEGPIVGVVKDFNFLRIQDEIGPLALMLDPSAANYLLVRTDPNREAQALSDLRATWSSLVPESSFSYQFIGDTVERFFRPEERLGRIAGIFATLGVLVACLGLFGLAAFTAEQRRKEIGVRKVLGATVRSITLMLSGEFTVLVLVAFAVGAPVAYLVMKGWLADFPYRVAMPWWLYATAGLGALLIAWITVGYQSLRAAWTNPVDALRYE